MVLRLRHIDVITSNWLRSGIEPIRIGERDGRTDGHTDTAAAPSADHVAQGGSAFTFGEKLGETLHFFAFATSFTTKTIKI